MTNVTIVGVGALGSHLVQLLRSEEVDLTIIDFDRVEMKNVASQFHFKTSAGKNKASSLKQAMQFAYGRKIKSVGHKLTADNVSQLLGDANVLVDCLDNAEARNLVQVFAKQTGTACVHGALAAGGSFGQVLWTENFKADEAAPGAATCEDGEFLPFINATASFLAMAIQTYLRDGKKVGYALYPAGVQKI